MKTSESDHFCLRFERQMPKGGHINRCNYFDIFVSFSKETPSRSQKHGKSNTIIKGNSKMKKKNCKTLLGAAATITQDELCYAPELATFVALDGTLMATITNIESMHPLLGEPGLEDWDIPDDVEGHFIESIFTLSKALRSSLHAYYAAIKEDSDDDSGEEQEISF